MNLAIIENYNYHIHILGGGGIQQYRFYTDRSYMRKIFPKKNNLIINWNKNDILCRFGPTAIPSTYQYRNVSSGMAFIKEWNDTIKKDDDGEYYYFRSTKTNIKCVFIKSIYHINNIVFVEINYPVMGFFKKLKRYYSNKVKMKKEGTLSLHFLLNRQIYGRKKSSKRI